MDTAICSSNEQVINEVIIPAYCLQMPISYQSPLVSYEAQKFSDHDNLMVSSCQIMASLCMYALAMAFPCSCWYETVVF